jgi:hypothetical protein
MRTKSQLLLFAALLLFSAWAAADLPGKHPYYLHALSDLRSARWMLQHRAGDATVSASEDVAVTEINKAIGAIKHAAIDDGKNIEDHPSVDLPPDDRGRLHKALDLLNKVHSDVAREEDDPLTRELRDRAVGHIDAARDATKSAISAVEQGR